MVPINSVVTTKREGIRGIGFVRAVSYSDKHYYYVQNGEFGDWFTEDEIEQIVEYEIDE